MKELLGLLQSAEAKLAEVDAIINSELFTGSSSLATNIRDTICKLNKRQQEILSKKYHLYSSLVEVAWLVIPDHIRAKEKFGRLSFEKEGLEISINDMTSHPSTRTITLNGQVIKVPGDGGFIVRSKDKGKEYWLVIDCLINFIATNTKTVGFELDNNNLQRLKECFERLEIIKNSLDQ